MKEGDLVLVPLGNDMQEVGKILKIGCARKTDESDEVHYDGILVSANVSLYKSVYSPAEVVPWDDHKDEITARPLRRTRSVVTPSPSSSVRRQLSTSDEAVVDGKKPAAKRKCVSVEAPQKKQKRNQVTFGTSTDSDDAASPVVSHSLASKTATTSKKKAPANKKKTAPAVVLIHRDESSSKSSSDSNCESNRNISGNHEDNIDDDSDLLDRPFQVEYAATGRATCRRCDQRIAKGALRISHVPLFRGKPGFRVYRHMACATFSEEIQQISDVGGWQKLSKSDQVALEERIRESIVELSMEAQEVSPDELVQESFTGEMRPSAPGLSASLLPFQVEGTSWMYCQEVKNPDIRGGVSESTGTCCVVAHRPSSLVLLLNSLNRFSPMKWGWYVRPWTPRFQSGQSLEGSSRSLCFSFFFAGQNVANHCHCPRQPPDLAAQQTRRKAPAVVS